MSETPVIEPIYLRKSVRFYKIYGGLFLFSLFMSIVIRPLMSAYPDFLDMLVGLPIFAMFIMAPIGLYYSWKSYKRKEGKSSTRFKYFLGHMFFCLLIMLFVVVIISDISKLL